MADLNENRAPEENPGTEGTDNGGEQAETKVKKNGKLTLVQKIIILILIILIIIALLHSCNYVVKYVYVDGGVSSGDYEQTVEIVYDTQIIEGTPEVDGSLGWSEITGDEGYVFRVYGILYEEDGQVAIMFDSDEDNTVSIRLQMTNTSGKLLGETGFLSPGTYVKYITLDTVPEEDCTVWMIVSAYDSEGNAVGNVTLETTLYVD